MPQSDSILGTRIRQRRREVGLTQSDLAARVGVSPSYLNLIEWNKRRIAGALLTRIAETLEIAQDDLYGVSERRLLDRLQEIAHQPYMADLGLEEDRVGELVGRFPGWARGIAALARAEREANRRAQSLSDRLTNDPYLNETVHRMLTRISALRSAAEILRDYPNLPRERRARFQEILNDESRVLSETSEALAAYLDKANESESLLTPIDEVEAFFASNGNHFKGLEKAALLSLKERGLRHRLPSPTEARVCLEEDLGSEIESLISQAADLKTQAARNRARNALSDYALGALLMPLSFFAEQAEHSKYDAQVLAGIFAVNFELVCHRLTALAGIDPGASRVPRFGYFRANAAGTMIEMLGLPDLSVPRYAAACPLWVLYSAQQAPGTVIRQRVVFPRGERFVFVARARQIGASGFGKPRHFVTDMLAVSEQDSHHTVYRPDMTVLTEEVGPSCRLCPRTSCLHRVEDPLSG